jgi:hypothetical protein
LLVQQEGPSPMAESVMSQTSTSSSSNGGSSLHHERDNFPPARRFSRSSADDDDSDPCTSYPYLPLDDRDRFSRNSRFGRKVFGHIFRIILRKTDKIAKIIT